MALALHVDATLETGKIGYRAGYSLANVDSVDITMHGRGGHGAAPHTTIDPIVQAAQLVVSLQTLVSREMNPVEPAVVTVGSIHGGTKHNVIPDTCQLQLTVRSFQRRSARSDCWMAFAARPTPWPPAPARPSPRSNVLDEHTPALFNDEKLVERIAAGAAQDAGRGQRRAVGALDGGEDFSRYGRAGVPIFMFRLGSVEPKRLAGLEARRAGAARRCTRPSTIPTPNRRSPVGVTAMCAAVLDLLPPKK